MKSLFVGSTEEYLSTIAKKHDSSAFLVNSQNYKQFLDTDLCTGYTALGDLPKDTNIFCKILLDSDQIHYCPPTHWKEKSLENNLYYNTTEEEQSLTELFLLYVSKYKTVLGLDHISNHHCTLDFDSNRVTDEPQLWVSGCSNTYGTGVDHEDTWAYLLHKSLKMPYKNLAITGTSNPWSADRLLRSDIRKNDIVVWGLTNLERISWIENSKLHKLTAHNYSIHKHYESMLSAKYLLSENTLHDNLTSIEQVANFCKKIQATFFCFLTFPECHTLYKFLHNKSYFLDIDFNLIINKSTNEWQIQRLDYGSDNVHPGKKHHLYWHNNLLKQIQNRQINSTQG